MQPDITTITFVPLIPLDALRTWYRYRGYIGAGDIDYSLDRDRGRRDYDRLLLNGYLPAGGRDGDGDRFGNADRRQQQRYEAEKALHLVTVSRMRILPRMR